MEDFGPHQTVSVEINARLAAQYKAAYAREIDSKNALNQSLATFISHFVEDRLSEEIEFLESEYGRDSR